MKRLISAEALSSLIGSIYDCTLDPGRWPETLERLRIALDFHNASISLLALPAGDLLLNTMTGVPAHWLERVPQYVRDVAEQWGGAERRQSYPLGEPLVLSRVRDRSEWENNRYVVEWTKPQGIHDVMAIGLTRDSTSVGTIGFGRHESAGEIRDVEIEAARLLSPHILRAVAITRLLDAKSIVAETFEATLDTLAIAILLVDADLRIIHANVAARTMLAVGDPIEAHGGVLAACSPVAASALAAAVRQASEDEAGIGGRGLGIPAPRADGDACRLHVLPLKHGAVGSRLSPAAAAAVFVAPAASPPAAPKEILAALLISLRPRQASLRMSPRA
jgi:PAS domain-containing protein